MSEQEIAARTLDSILGAGFDKASCRVVRRELHEIQAENGEVDLFRTNFETDIGLVGIDQQRRATLSVNKTDEAALGNAINDLKSMAAGAQADPAFDIAENQPAESFEGGIAEPEYDAMYDRIVELRDYAKEAYPSLNLRSSNIYFVKSRSCFVNSNEVCFESERGLYQVGVQFSSKEGTDTSSMMYTGFGTVSLDKPIYETNDIDHLFRQSTEQVRTQNLPGKFKGDLIITPHCLDTFLGFLTQRIRDAAMISGTSVYQDKVGEMVASPLLTVSSMPLGGEIDEGYWVTGDGYKAENSTLIEKGKLNSYLLSLYGANKTGLPRAMNSGGCYVYEPGDKSLDEMIGEVEQGVLITRFSGGRPNDRGDFSGVAKNSYYIKDGKVEFPIKETTVSGNMVELLQSINAVSKERLSFGNAVEPWVRAPGVTAS
jgi:PmbA protein